MGETRSLAHFRASCWSDEDEEDLTIEGTMAFCEEISLPLEDATVLALSYVLKSPQMGYVHISYSVAYTIRFPSIIATFVQTSELSVVSMTE